MTVRNHLEEALLLHRKVFGMMGRLLTGGLAIWWVNRTMFRGWIDFLPHRLRTKEVNKGQPFPVTQKIS